MQDPASSEGCDGPKMRATDLGGTMIADQGYEVHVRERDLLLINRRLWGATYALFILGALAGVLCILAALLFVGVEEVRTEVPAVALLFAVLALAAPIPFLLRRIKERRRVPLEDVSSVLVLDRESNELRGSMGEILAQLDDVRAAMHIDWMTRGLARLVVLWWPGGRRVVFRSFRRKHALRVLEVLLEACGGASRPGL